jgi:hypothetical protein
LEVLTVEAPLQISGGVLRYTGTPGGVEPVELIKKLDVVSDSVSYLGEANPGTLTSAPAWRIKKITTFNDGDIDIQYAEGSTGFTVIWDNRANYTYA